MTTGSGLYTIHKGFRVATGIYSDGYRMATELKNLRK